MVQNYPSTYSFFLFMQTNNQQHNISQYNEIVVLSPSSKYARGSNNGTIKHLRKCDINLQTHSTRNLVFSTVPCLYPGESAVLVPFVRASTADSDFQWCHLKMLPSVLQQWDVCILKYCGTCERSCKTYIFCRAELGKAMIGFLDAPAPRKSRRCHHSSYMTASALWMAQSLP